MTKARTLADFISDGSPLADGTIDVSEVSGAAPLASPTFTGTVNLVNSNNSGKVVVVDVDQGDVISVGDLEIYDDRTSGIGYMSRTDTSTQVIGADAVVIMDRTGQKSLAHFAYSGDTGVAKLRYWDSNGGYDKLSTSLAGISVVGTATADGFTGPLTGAVTGAVTGNLTGDVTGNLTGDLELAAIAATKSDTAVDVFVYDTSKDSDGGAWRKRTQATSWYNEALNTATRGSRKEFPAVAVIVVDNDGLYIYDGDDPNLPMWMKANDVSSGMLFNGANANAVTAKNGIIALAASSAFWVMHFVDDRGDLRNSSRRYDYKGNIEQRNDALGYIDQETSGALVHHVINDVAMTVLPNAPIDAATGLPVPTIGIATNGGTSIIRDDGTVDNHSDSKSNTAIEILGTNYAILRNVTGVPLEISPLNDAGAAIMNYRDDGGLLGSYYPQLMVGFDPTSTVKSSYGAGKGLNILDDDILSTSTIAQPLGKVAYITSDYNTGWQVGAIKLATLSDTDDTNITGAELVTGDNSTFTGSIGDWVDPFYGTTPTNSGGYLTFASTGSYMQARLTISSALTVGKTYTMSFDNIAGIGVNFYATVEGTTITVTTAGVYTITFVATSTTLLIDFKRAATSGTCQLDNISVRLAEEDRSVNNNGLQVFGTVTKTPVATGADLVAYSGFSDSTNYHQQPYNLDLNFGTGDFAVSLWHLHTDVALNNTIYFAARGAEWNVGCASDASYLWVIGGVIEARSSAGTVVEQSWTNLNYVRRSGTTEIWVNGLLKASDSSSTGNVDSSTSMLEVPKITSCGDGHDHISLLRISGTAPSPEQIAKIYNDEKVLFQENAQATLYGSSDAVIALAHDDTTDLLHVGTSDGRSVFQGLRRVENTTDAVGAAISASNGLVVEE